MTDDEGKVLPECIENITKLKVSEEILSSRVDEFGKQVNRFQEATVKQSLLVQSIKADMDKEVLPVIRNLPQSMADAVRESQNNCPIFKQLKQKEDNTVKRLLDSDPPNKPVKTNGRVPSWVKSYLLQAIGTFLLAAAAAISGYYVAQPSNGKVPVQKVEKQ